MSTKDESIIVLEQQKSLSAIILARSTLVILIVTAICVAQTTQKKPTQKKRAAHSTFACPDAEAQQACKSYTELLKVKDTSLPSNAYVCFRRSVDEFFLISFSQPLFRKKWDPDARQMMVDTEYMPVGRGYGRTYKNGIEDSSAIPSLFFSGQWIPSSPFQQDEGTFSSDKINSTKSDENDRTVGVSIEESQVNIAYKFKNRFEKTILYTLAIQRSTGRFAESYYDEASKIPFSENAGYCVHRTEGAARNEP